MRNTKKKGFTIVELVIVVAVIAILSSVLIPTVAGLIEKANVSKDAQLVRQLNTALATDLDGKNETMHEALEATADAGLDVAKIVAKSKYGKILWDSKNNVFCYEANGEIEYNNENAKVEQNVADVDYWTVSDTIDEKYSTYYVGTETEITTNKGFDTNSNSIISVKYSNPDNAQSVLLRTNGGTLTIDAAADDVKHYGYANEVRIEKVANNSYYENGDVFGFINLKSGHVVLNAAKKYVVKIDAVAENVTNGSVFVNVTAANDAEIQLYADSDVINAIKNSGEDVFSGVDTTAAKSKDDLKTISSVTELEAIITQVNNGSLVAPMVYIPEGNYQFTKPLTINKSIAIVGTAGKTTLLGYDNPKAVKDANAFSVKITEKNQRVSFTGLNFDGFGLYANKESGTLIASGKPSYSGIYADVDISTVINISSCNFAGLAHSFINAKGGTYNISDCLFDGSIQSYDWPNVTQFGDYTGSKKTTVNITDSTFIGAGNSMDSDADFTSTLLSPWANTNINVSNSHFENCYEAISGGSEYYDYTGTCTVSNNTFSNCGKDIRIAKFVNSTSNIPGSLKDYKCEETAVKGVMQYIIQKTNSDGNSVTYIYYVKA